jgi:hypothetical protein
LLIPTSAQMPYRWRPIRHLWSPIERPASYDDTPSTSRHAGVTPSLNTRRAMDDPEAALRDLSKLPHMKPNVMAWAMLKGLPDGKGSVKITFREAFTASWPDAAGMRANPVERAACENPAGS